MKVISGLLVGISLVCLYQLASGDNGTPTKQCGVGQYTVGCHDPILNLLVQALGPLKYDIMNSNGCVCQNNGAGPNCPLWLTCPQPLKYPIIAGYELLNLFYNNTCHCQCVRGECPGFEIN